MLFRLLFLQPFSQSALLTLLSLFLRNYYFSTITFFLAFDCSDNNTLDQIFLYEWVDQHNRKNTNHCHRHTNRRSRQFYCTCSDQGCIRIRAHRLNVIHNLHQQLLDTVKLFITDIVQSIRPVIPVADSGEQTNSCNCRYRKWKHNLKENL